ncbi:hypothetical protein C8J57DRAFT_1511040 [Mycena rebaudengoi]|nr:hypothetical protein C8J57DRAFT_1538773 [Mycena rebaudengoi]KAJ7266095.1 hypothetical protein C8J57DRAFT_1511040 [Mycena rebaudengoi]
MMARGQNRLQVAASLGATHFITFSPNAVEEVMALTGGRGVDPVRIEAAGVPGTFDPFQEIVAVAVFIVIVSPSGILPTGSTCFKSSSFRCSLTRTTRPF